MRWPPFRIVYLAEATQLASPPCLATAAPWFGQTYDTSYVVCHRSFSHPPLFSISFVGASSFQRTQLYVGFGFQMKRGFFGFILRPAKLVRMRVRVRLRVHVTGGVLARGLTYVGRLSGRPHWRWPNQSAAVAKLVVRSGEIPSPGQTSSDKTNDCAIKSERGTPVRGSDPPSGHSVHKTTGDKCRALARHLTQTHLGAAV